MSDSSLKNQVGLSGENINSTTLQDYSEYQLSFRQEKSSVTPLDNILDNGQFSARQLSENQSHTSESYQ